MYLQHDSWVQTIITVILYCLVTFECDFSAENYEEVFSCGAVYCAQHSGSNFGVLSLARQGYNLETFKNES